MQITILTVGKPSRGSFADLINEYQKRLARTHMVVWSYVDPSSSKDPRICRQEESKTILQLLKPADSIILLDERGQMMNNNTLLTMFEKYAATQGRLIFVIGGAFGVDDSVRMKAHVIWSLSELVFPHQLARVMLMEQLYRTIQLQVNHPYHHT